MRNPRDRAVDIRNREDKRGRTRSTSVPYINYLNDVEGFIAAWDLPALPAARARHARKKVSNAATIYSRLDPAFYSSLEPGVRDLVLALIKALDCVTYSSCEGHWATSRAPTRLFHVGILVRTPAEHIKFSKELRRLAHHVNRKSGPHAPYLHIDETHLDSESGRWPCFDLFFVLNGLSEDAYFTELPGANRALLNLISKHYRGCNGGRSRRSPYAGIVNAFEERSTSDLCQRFRNALPYPHLCFSRLLTQREAKTILSAIPQQAWNRVIRAEYQFAVVDLLAQAFSRRGCLQRLVEMLASKSICETLSTITGGRRLALDALHAHRMSRGQSVSVHTDSQGHFSAVRLIIYLDDRRQDQGGLHLLLRERARDYVVEEYVVPRVGLALLFPMDCRSLHAVTPVATIRNRHTLIATYVPRRSS